MAAAANNLNKAEQIGVLMLENHAFDHTLDYFTHR
jgi:phospholipase C